MTTMTKTRTKAKTKSRLRTTKPTKTKTKKTTPTWNKYWKKTNGNTWQHTSYTNHPMTGYAASPTPYTSGYAPGYSGYAPPKMQALFSDPNMQEKVNRLFDEMVWQVENDMEGRPWTPRCDWWESGRTYTIRAYVPGCTQKDCHISLQGSTLTIYGTTSAKPCPTKSNCFCNECYTGSFQRYFNFPVSVDPKKIKAVCKNGVLTVTLQKTSKSKYVPVKVS